MGEEGKWAHNFVHVLHHAAEAGEFTKFDCKQFVRVSLFTSQGMVLTVVIIVIMVLMVRMVVVRMIMIM